MPQARSHTKAGKTPESAAKTADAAEPCARISRRASEKLRAGHVWVYRSEIEQLSTEEPGLVPVTDARGIPLGSALLSPASQIALRMVSDNPRLGWKQWLSLLEERLRAAIARRRGMLDDATSACRLVFSEADGLPGIVIDQYGGLVLVQLLTRALDREDVRAAAVRVLREELAPETIVERADARIRSLEQMSEPSSQPLYAKHPDADLKTIFRLNGLSFHYDANAGQKTGAFLDQRLNYAAAARYAAGDVLDVCTYQGGFVLHMAASGRCSRVTGADISRAALEVAEENLAANRNRIRAEVDWIEANAFDLLRDWSAAGTQYSTIVLDPPAFAKSKRAAAGALRGYKELNLRALKMLRPGGTLITCSCSHHVSLDEFTGAVAAAAGDARRRVRLIERRGAAPDHPVVLNIPETEYLKCLILAAD